MGIEIMNLTVHYVSIDYIRIDCSGHQPEINVYLKLSNESKKTIGTYCVSSQKYHSDIQYRMTGEARLMIDSIVQGLTADILNNYVTFDKTSEIPV